MNNTIDTNAIKDRIRKLFALANDDAAMGGEIDNALRFANRLMQQHNFTEADLANPQGAHERAAKVEYGSVQAGGNGLKVTDWEVTLAMAIAKLVGTCKQYLERHKSQAKTTAGTLQFDANGREIYRQHVVFYGPIEDCNDAKQLFAEWSVLICAMARMKTGTALRGPGRSYSEGFASALYEKVQFIQAADQNLIGTTALVVLNANAIMAAKRKCATDWLERERGIKLVRRSSGYANPTNYGAREMGRADGARASFTRTVKPKITGR